MERFQERFSAVTEEMARYKRGELLDFYREYDPIVTINPGNVPLPGSSIETSPTYGKTEPGYVIILDRTKEKVQKCAHGYGHTCPGWRETGCGCPLEREYR